MVFETLLGYFSEPSPIIFFVLALIIFIILDVINPLLSDISIFLYFAWAYTNIEGSTTIATFYLIAVLFVIVVRLAQRSFSLKDHSEKPIMKLLGINLTGKLPILGVGLGIGIFLIMRMLQGVSTASIIGTPTLALSSDIMSVVTISLLGIVETRLFFTIFNLFKENVGVFTLIPFVGMFLGIFAPVVPVIFVSVLFGIFHLTAYSLSLSAILFAVMVMVIWIISFIITKSDLPANISHYLWNGIVVLNRILGIAI